MGFSGKKYNLFSSYYLLKIAIKLSVYWSGTIPKQSQKCLYHILEGTAQNAGLLLALAKGFGPRPRLFLHLRQKKQLSNLSNFENNPTNLKKSKKYIKKKLKKSL